MEEKKIDLLSEIKKDIVKEKSVSSLAKKYDISEYEVLGLVKKLKDEGINVTYSEKNKDAYIIINDHPDFTKENDYYITEDVDSNTKIAFISDTRFGSKNEQIAIFERQLVIAERLNLPVVIHSRDATLDTIEILKRHKVKGVIHSFSGSYETACIYIKMGFVLGVNGVVTFKNCNLKDVLAKIPLGNIILETDCPYLTPVPYRGRKNEPAHIKDIAMFLCQLYDVDLTTLENITNENIKRLFDI